MLDFAIVAVRADIDRPIDVAWLTIGDFLAAGRFLNVPASLVGERQGLGSVRLVGDGILEVLVGVAAYSYTYAQVDGPMAPHAYHGCVKLEPAGVEACRLDYTVIFDRSSMEKSASLNHVERLTTRFQGMVLAVKKAVEASS